MAKGCYTCRRRRIICDNGLPTCQKCRDAGKECLGYQKPLTWVKGGVASRGKMMGRSFDDVVKKDPRRTGEPSRSQIPPSTVDVSNENETDIEKPGDVVIHNAPDTSTVQPLSAAFQPEENDLVSASRNAHAMDFTSVPWGLIDPPVKDLSDLSRFYILHFNENTAKDLVLYSNTQNPYRDLTSLVGESPLLANALSATGALHYALLANGDFSPMPWPGDGPTATGTLLSPQEVEKAVTSSRPSSKVYEHFLKLKQRALRQLSRDLCDPVKRNDEMTAAAIMVLALMDAIESGDEAWKYHLEGAKKLLNNRQQGSDAGRSKEIIGWLDTLTIDGCLIIELMGSTLARPGVLSKPFYTPSLGPTALRRLEKTSWVGCPAYLLEVIFFVHARFCHSEAAQEQQPMLFSSSFLPETSQPLQSPEALLHHIQAFDPHAWAISLQSHLHLPDLTMRIALATTYKAAVYLYTSRVLSRPRAGLTIASSWFGLPADHSAVANLLIHQLSVIPAQDPHFKCLIWPTFIAGAECRDPALRPRILETLSTLYYAVATINVRNAAWVLSLMWRKQDLRREQQQASASASNAAASSAAASGPGSGSGLDLPLPAPAPLHDGDDFDWVQELDESRIDWLFI